MTFEPTSAPEAPASATPANDSLGVDDAVSLLQKAREMAPATPPGGGDDDENKKKKQTPPVPDNAPEEDSDDGDLGDDDDAEEDDDAPDPAEEAQEKDDGIKYPASWGKDGAEVFAKLPSELRAEIARRESEREAYANAKAQEAATVRKELAETANWATSELQKTLTQAQAAIQGEFAGIDWAQLKQQDPTTFIQLSGMYEQRMNAVQAAMHQHQQLSEKAQQEQLQTFQQHLKSEMDSVLPFLKESVPNFEPKSYAGELKAYLMGVGVPEEAVGRMSNSWEMKIATKAMLYDQAQAKRKAAASKVAQAPQVMTSKGKGSNDMGGKDQARKAMNRLAQTGSVDDALAALRAMRSGRN